MGWTDERVELLKKLWMEGLSASQIAAELGGVTRNAVIGKIHRIGLSGRAKGTASNAARRKPAATRSTASPKAARQTNGTRSTSQPVAVVKTAAATDIEKPEMLLLDLLQLTEQTCKFPIGDPQEENFAFCGVRSKDGEPYCEYHCSLAYQPNADRRNRASRGAAKSPAAASGTYRAV
ncbi:MAG: GcrA cell cycle regulator [Nitratireductor sp.]|nr:GcrA cell cycle regulator [Nitratireductor sp.]